MDAKNMWIEVNSDADFAPRDGAGLLSFKDKLWLLGGWNPKDKINFPKVCNSEVWSSDDGRKWTLVLKEAPWEGRHTFGHVVHDNKMWIVGGDCIQGRFQPDVWNSEDGISWVRVCEEAPWGQRALHYTASFDGNIWVMGGQTMPDFVPDIPETIYYNDVWCSSDGRDWICVTENAGWMPRGMIGASAVKDGAVWIIGGGTYDTSEFPVRKYFNDVWKSSDGVNWSCVSEDNPFKPRSYHEIYAYNDKLWVLEGTDGILKTDGTTNINDVWISGDGKDWIELKNTPWLPRHAASVASHRDHLYVVAGNNMTSDVWKIKL